MARLPSTTRSLSWLREQLDASERRLLIQAIVIGVVVWAFVAFLKWSVHAALDVTRHLIDASPHVAFVLVPLMLGAAGVATVARSLRRPIYYRDANAKVHTLDAVEGDGVERAIALYFSSEPSLDRALIGERGLDARWRLPTFSLALRKMLATWFTLSSGGAGGLEASVTLVGESAAAALFKPRVLPKFPAGTRRPQRASSRPGFVAASFARLVDWWRASQPEDLQAAQLCGISAAVSTLLGTPFAAAFFAIEVIYRRRPIVDRLIYALVSSLIAFFIEHLVSGDHRAFIHVSARPPLYDLRYYTSLAVVALSMALLSSLFRAARSWAEQTYRARFAERMARHLVGAVVTGSIGIAVVMVLPQLDVSLPADAAGHRAIWLVLGMGENVINDSLEGKFGLGLALVVLAGRFLATISTITSGGSAGLLFPTLTFGCLLASAWASAFGILPALLVIPAMTASLVSIANVPLAAIMLVVEAFGSHFIVPSMFVLVISSLFAHDNSIYRAQRDSFDAGQLLPGVSVRRIRVPSLWAGQDLRTLGIRERHGLTVIGMVDRREDASGEIEERVVLNPRPDQTLTRGDLLIVLGEDDRLEAFTTASAEATLT